MDEVQLDCIIPNNKKDSQALTTAGPSRIQSIIYASKARGDDIHESLEDNLSKNPDLTVQCHRSCVGTYTSKHHIDRAVHKRGRSDERSQNEPPPRRRRSLESTFEFQKHCIFFAERFVQSQRTEIHLDGGRWYRVTDKLPWEILKDKILRTCSIRADTQS